MNGWIKLHRKLLYSNVFDNEKLLKVFIYCLLRASHSSHNQQVGRQIVQLEQGQFIFGRKKAAMDLNLKESTVRDYMNVLKTDGVIDIKSTNKYSIVTVENWEVYQEKDESTDTNSDIKSTSEQHQINTNKNVKNEKNEKNIPATATKVGWYDKFHQCFNRVPTAIQIDSIHHFLDDGVEEDLLMLAFEKAGLKNATFRYAQQILTEWVQKGIKTIEQGKEESRKFNVIKGGKPNGQNGRDSAQTKREGVTGGKVGRLFDTGFTGNLDEYDFF